MTSGGGWNVGLDNSKQLQIYNDLSGDSIPLEESASQAVISSNGELIVSGEPATIDDINYVKLKLTPNPVSRTSLPTLSVSRSSDLFFNLHAEDECNRDFLIMDYSSASTDLSMLSPFEFEFASYPTSVPERVSMRLLNSFGQVHEVYCDVSPGFFFETGSSSNINDPISLSVAENSSLSEFHSNTTENAVVSNSAYSTITFVDGVLTVSKNKENMDVLGYEDVTLQFGSGDAVVEREVRLEYGRNLALKPGWNLVGVPYALSDKSLSDLESASLSTWGWDGTQYQSATSFERGKAYWVFTISDNADVVLSPTVEAPAKNGDLSDEEKTVVLNSEWNLFSPLGYGKSIDSEGYVWRWDNGLQIYTPTQSVEKITPLEGIWQKNNQGWIPNDDDDIFPVLLQSQ